MSTYHSSRTHRASKPHLCEWCGGLILPGTTYVQAVGVTDCGSFFHDKSHETCRSLVDLFAEANNFEDFARDEFVEWATELAVAS